MLRQSETRKFFELAGREHTGLAVLVNISQLTVPLMSLTETTVSLQQRLRWLAEQVLNRSGVRVVHNTITPLTDTRYESHKSLAPLAERINTD